MKSKIDLVTQPAADIIQIIPFETADTFLDALRPTASPWRGKPDSWIYRGHADSSWKLLPSVNRRACLRRFLPSVPLPTATELYWEPTFEESMSLLLSFMRALNRAGRDVPGGDEARQVVSEYWYKNLAAPELNELTALAQHHGIPTGLLDWSLYGKNAAYFAASDAVSYLDDKGDLAVWALNIVNGRTPEGLTGIAGDGMAQIRIIEPPRASNPNLHAQAGLFTLAMPMSQPHIKSKVEMLAFEEIAGDFAAYMGRTDVVLYKLTLPRKEAGALLKWLAYEPVTGAMLFPSVDGVARDVADQSRWPI
jgi:hypothetical protein